MKVFRLFQVWGFQIVPGLGFSDCSRFGVFRFFQVWDLGFRVVEVQGSGFRAYPT